MMAVGDVNIYSMYMKVKVNINDKNKFEKESSSELLIQHASLK